MSFTREDKGAAGESRVPAIGKFLASIETPALIARTLIGNPLYTTPDAINEISDNYLGQLDVADLVYKDFEDIPISKLYTQFDNVKFILSARQCGVKKAESNCDASGMNIDTHNGRKQLNVAKYLQRIGIDQPKVVVALADEVSTTLGKKRLTKAIERTTTWFQNMVSSSHAAGIDFSDGPADDAKARAFLFGVAQYDRTYTIQLPLIVKNMLAQGARGIVIGNSHLGESKEQRAESVTAIMALLPSQVPTMIQGADTLAEILQSLSLGVDLISTNYPECLSKAGRALAVRLPGDAAVMAEDTAVVEVAEADGESSRKHALPTDSTTTTSEPSTKRPRIDYSNPHTVPAATSTSTTTASTGQSACANTRGSGKSAAKPVAPSLTDFPLAKCEMNLWDVKYRKDTRPLMPGCTCHGCRHHTRAYIHHLHLCHEILAEVLLYHHNMHQLRRLFEAARQSLHDTSFEAFVRSLEAQL